MPPVKAIGRALYWTLPSLFCLIVYWSGYKVWFHDDDFAFLGLWPGIHSWRDLSDALFQPTGHGTWRPLSERAYFIGVQWLFGVPQARPFRIIAFLTQFANLILIAAITWRLTRSQLAGFLAPVLWIANSALVTVMVWNCAFMYALCGLVFLSCFWFLVRYIETNRVRYYAALWCIFLTGFLVMETNLVFPLLAASYALLCARSYFFKTLPLFVPSIAFFAGHQLLIHKQTGGPYAMHFDAGIFKTFGAYWAAGLNPLVAPFLPRFPQSVATAGVLLFTLALGGFVVWQVRKGNLLPTFFLTWFAVVLSPVLPLRDHFTDYYLTLPLIGIAMLSAYAFAVAYRQRILFKTAATVLLALYLVECVPSARGAARWNYDRSQRIKRLVLGVAAANKREPGKTILLDGVDEDVFNSAISQSSFRFLSLPEVYLTPGSEACLAGNSALLPVSHFVVAADKAQAAFEQNQLLVLRWDQDSVTDITKDYEPAQPAILDVADPAAGGDLGAGWYPKTQGYRWMPKSAEVVIKGPRWGCHKLYLSGYCPKAQVASGPLGLIVSVNGVITGPLNIERGDAPFEFSFPVRPAAQGIYHVAVEVDRTFTTASDKRALGLAFGRFEIR
ncbi:MAG: hypothetical protein M3Z32_12955 [Acidobacteriota bacterium]|nr:hypothetical protein [Acidobacteriota bacterium]